MTEEMDKGTRASGTMALREEIIIDGVDVAGCEYYKGKCMEYTHYCQIGCKECTDIGTKLCHYKQTERFKAKIDRLEQENKELKEENITAQKEYWKLEQGNDFLAEKVGLYRSALEEIKVISDNYNLTVNKRKKQITDKINEVLNGV